MRRVDLEPCGSGSLLVLLLCLAVAAMLEKKPAYYAEEARAWILRRCVVPNDSINTEPWRGVASRGAHLGYSAAKVRHLLWTFGKWYFPHVTHFRFLGWVLGRFPEIVNPGNLQHCSVGHTTSAGTAALDRLASPR